MKYFRNYEVANLYRVSQATVGRWVEQAKHGKISLDLHEHAGKSYIANTEHNRATIENLIGERRKFRNTNAAKTITPKPEFYQLFAEGQIYDIVQNLDLHREIPRQYNYFDGGAAKWDEYARRLAAEETPNLLNSTVRLLEMNQGYLDAVLADYKQINIVDIGVGDALPIKNLLEHLLKQGRLGRYVAIDISADMLKIARDNIEKWFGDKIEFEGYEMDIACEAFGNILAQEYVKPESRDSANLILLLGGTPYNLRDPDVAFGVVNASMGRKDLLVYTTKLDTATTRRYFDFNTDQEAALAPIHSFVLKLLNINASLFDVEMGFDERLRQRYTRVRLKVALTLKFEFEEGEVAINLDKGEAILVWRGWQQTAQDVLDQFSRKNFDVVHASQTLDQEYMLTVSKVHTDR